MAKALVEVIGDSASAVRALEQTSAALTATGDAAKGAAVDMDAFAASMARAQATRAETLLAQAGSLRQLASTSVAGSTEQLAANEAAVRRQTQAYRLLGIQAATTGESLTKTAGTVGRGLTTYVTAPTAFIGYEAVKQAIDFNQQMLLLKTQAGDATDSIQKLSAEVLKLASSGAPQGPVQLSEGLYHLVSLGLRGAQAMGTLREASLAAGMGMANLEDTSTALGAAVVSGIKGAQNYQQAMATLVGTAGAGNMRFQDLAASIGNVIPSAAAAGITLHEMGAALAVLTDRGMSSEEAATRLRMSLALIQRPSQAATKALADMGVNADDLGAMIRQPNGLLKVLEVLHTAIDSVGAVRGNRDLLEAFGGARSGIGIQTLVQSLTSDVSSYEGKLAQITQDQAQFAQNQQTYLESPAYKLHAALSTVEADLVKLGTSLTPVVTGVATAVSTVADAFTALPGPVKEAAGVIIGLFAAAGPIALGISGIGKLLGGMGRLFTRLIPESTVAMTTIGAEADAASGQLSLLATAEARVGTAAVAAGAEAEAGFAAMLGPIAAATAAVYGLDKALKALTGFDALKKVWGSAGFGADNLHDAIRKPGSKNPYPMGTSDYANWEAGFRGTRPPGDAAAGRQTAAYKAGERARDHDRPTHPGSSRSASPTVPDVYTSKPTVPGTTSAAATAAAKKHQTAFDHAVRSDQMLAQARLDLANGEVSAAQALLVKDQARLQAMLSEASTADERLAITKQLTEVQRLRHTKADAFQLPPALQAEIAKANAEAVLDPQGMVSQQVALAKQARADAMKAIHSHTLTMQGLIQAWQIVGQEDQVIAGALGLANSYHAESTAALTKGLGLTHAADMTLRERLAQSEAHRGFAPNAPTTGFGNQHPIHHQRPQHPVGHPSPMLDRGGRPMPVHIDVKLVGDIKKIISEVETYTRRNQQRAGGRR